MLDKLRSVDFVPLLHQMFRVQLNGTAPLDLELISVTELGAPYGAGRRAPYSLIFLGPVSADYLRQDIYHLENGKMEAIDLFIVPLGPAQGRMQYEAILT